MHFCQGWLPLVSAEAGHWGEKRELGFDGNLRGLSENMLQRLAERFRFGLHSAAPNKHCSVAIRHCSWNSSLVQMRVFNVVMRLRLQRCSARYRGDK
jgi:hypothetical protein